MLHTCRIVLVCRRLLRMIGTALQPGLHVCHACVGSFGYELLGGACCAVREQPETYIIRSSQAQPSWYCLCSAGTAAGAASAPLVLQLVLPLPLQL